MNKLSITTQPMTCVKELQSSSVPSLGEMINVQNKENIKHHLTEDDGLFIGYGKIRGCYPYKEQNGYDSNLVEREVEVAILENDYIRATFLTEFGGRLWELYDKTLEKNLLYTNDVIQPRNLAIRNAWFSGGVEWNMGAIGHGPFTCERMYVCKGEREDGTPILRMYEYERIRQVTYQMDFWLEEDYDALFCRMRIHNTNDHVVPMYWWSNIAVPEYEDGRVLVPATKSYKNSVDHSIHKVNIPVDEQVESDITYYNSIKTPVDYFFDIHEGQQKFIANIDNQSTGLLQYSSSKLKGRKLFSWGHIPGSDHWQEILTHQAGPYVEIQAGLAKTQYECIPMPPQTSWEWMECYRSLFLDEGKVPKDYMEAVSFVDNVVTLGQKMYPLDEMVKNTKDTIGRKPFELIRQGSPYGALENMLRGQSGGSLSEHLHFNLSGEELEHWGYFLQHGTFKEMDIDTVPRSFMIGEQWEELLEKSSGQQGQSNWYVWYQLGLIYYSHEKSEKAIEALKTSAYLKNNCWAYHGLSYMYAELGDLDKSTLCALQAMELRPSDYSLCESCLKLILNNEDYTALIDVYCGLAPSVKVNGRIKMYLGFAYLHTGNIQRCEEVLEEIDRVKLEDIREGETSITDLWIQLTQLKYPEMDVRDIEVPDKYDYRMYS